MKNCLLLLSLSLLSLAGCRERDTASNIENRETQTSGEAPERAKARAQGRAQEIKTAIGFGKVFLEQRLREHKDRPAARIIPNIFALDALRLRANMQSKGLKSWTDPWFGLGSNGEAMLAAAGITTAAVGTYAYLSVASAALLEIVALFDPAVGIVTTYAAPVAPYAVAVGEVFVLAYEVTYLARVPWLASKLDATLDAETKLEAKVQFDIKNSHRNFVKETLMDYYEYIESMRYGSIAFSEEMLAPSGTHTRAYFGDLKKRLVQDCTFDGKPMAQERVEKLRSASSLFLTKAIVQEAQCD